MPVISSPSAQWTYVSHLILLLRGQLDPREQQDRVLFRKQSTQSMDHWIYLI